MSYSSLLRLPQGAVDLSKLPTDTLPGFTQKAPSKKKGGKKGGKGGVRMKDVGKAALASLGPELADLQECLWANGVAGDERRILLVLQGMDTAGKGGVVRKAVGLVDPQGVAITAFKAPTEEELANDFLWRIRRALPPAGYIGVFDRSHYEDVLIQRVWGLAPTDEIERRYDAINRFEAELVASGVTVIKCMLHISPDTQKERLAARLEDPTRHWKYDPTDIDDRKRWSEYTAAYETALRRTNTDVAPWYVIPSDRKWYRNLAAGHLLLEHLRALTLSWPKADFDVEVEKKRLAASVAQ